MSLNTPGGGGTEGSRTRAPTDCVQGFSGVFGKWSGVHQETLDTVDRRSLREPIRSSAVCGATHKGESIGKNSFFFSVKKRI